MPRKPRPLTAFEQARNDSIEALDKAMSAEPGTIDMPTLAKALQCEYGDEQRTDWMIKKHLRTNAQRAELAARDLSIPDLLNGRYDGEQEPFVLGLFDDWNKRLGVICFATDGRDLGKLYEPKL